MNTSSVVFLQHCSCWGYGYCIKYV